MGRAVLLDCLPWVSLLAASLVFLRMLVRLGGSRPRLSRLGSLHADEGGAAQSLSFVLTLPLFVMILLFIIQVSQLMIGTVVVHYAAFAAARSAIVWIPAAVGMELENRVAQYVLDPDATDQVFPTIDPSDASYGPGDGGLTYLVLDGPKRQKIASAAYMACMAICPSRDLGFSLSGQALAGAGLLEQAYRALAPGSAANPAISRRLRNKLAYASAATEVEIRFFHSNAEPPLVPYPDQHEPIRPTDAYEFAMWQELGWQDPITVRVTHHMALLPGPGRFLARQVERPDGRPDEVAARIRRNGNLSTYELTASATLGNEGEKSVKPYDYWAY
ncbi:MAG: hypothetical protein GXY83_29730 [Rhodopirellula sp.]|nr:hypothetical protein [Rhodopirellula sp.]